MKVSLKKSAVVLLSNLLERETGPSDKPGPRASDSWPLKFKYCLSRNKEKLQPEAKAISDATTAVYKPYTDKLISEGAIGEPRSVEKNRILDPKKYDEITREFSARLDEADKGADDTIEVEVHAYAGAVPETIPADLFDAFRAAKIIPEEVEEVKK